MQCQTKTTQAGTTRSGTKFLDAWATIRSTATLPRATSYQKTTPPISRSFQSDLPLGQEYENLYIERKKLIGETWAENRATTLDEWRQNDVYRVFPFPHVTTEVKADIRAVDRLYLEHKSLCLSRADRIAYFIEPLQQFYEVPRQEIWKIFRADQDLINAGRKPKHYIGPGGDVQPNGKRLIGTCIDIEEYVRLPNCQPV